MKVRHKATGIELEVRKPLTSKLYYYTTGGSLIHQDDTEWEAVPEEVWEDVTAAYKGCLTRLTPVRLRDDERITWIDGLHHGPAFIIERRKQR